MTMYDSQVINIGGEIRFIANYSAIKEYEDITNNSFTIENYLSIIMSNFGYNNMPNIEWLQTGSHEPIENAQKTNSLQLPKDLDQRNLLIRDDMTLFDVLCCVYYWGRGNIETGFRVDPSSSWRWPDNNTIKHAIENNLKIGRACAYTDRLYWPVTDILSRRLMNLCPNIDNDYYENCITRFNQYTMMMPLEDPRTLFIASICNPDLVLSIIRKSEKQAAKKINDKFKYPTLRPDYDTAIEFYVIINQELQKLSAAYKQYGATAFTKSAKTEILKNFDNKDKEIDISSTTIDTSTDRLAQLDTIEEKRQYVENTELNDKNKAFIFKYLDKRSLPEYLTDVKQKKVDENTIATEYNPQYIKLLKRIYCIFESIANNHNYWLNDDTKWIFSKPCYISANIFGLYNKGNGLFLLAYADLTYSLEEPQTVIKIYRNKYDQKILFVPDEMQGSFDAKATPNVEIESNIEDSEQMRYSEGE